jgi:hypothetical protein
MPETRVKMLQDEVSHLCGDIVERLNTLSAIGFRDNDLQAEILCAELSLDEALEPLLDLRREAGDLPSTGSMERAQIEAVGLRAKAVFVPESESQVVAESLVEDFQELVDQIDNALPSVKNRSAYGAQLRGLRKTAQDLRRRFSNQF